MDGGVRANSRVGLSFRLHHRRSSTLPNAIIPANMKLSGAFAASSLFCAVLAARPTVSPETARLIIAQRLGLSRFHAVEHADAETIRHINTYGGRQPKLFGAEDAHVSRAHLLVWAEDAEQDEATGGQAPSGHHRIAGVTG